MANNKHIRNRVDRPNKKVITFFAYDRDIFNVELVIRFLEQLGLETAILEKIPNNGRTIIEKLDDTLSSVDYAVVMLTPDDLGTFRPNPILELGLSYGKLGRKRVSILLCGNDSELPSDLKGVLYIRMDQDGNWKIALAQELQEAGLKIDFIKVLQTTIAAPKWSIQ